MFIPNYSYQKPDHPFTDSEIPLSEILPAESEFVVGKGSNNDIQWEEVSIDYKQEIGFFKGLLYAISAGIVFLFVLFLVVRELWINFGGGSIGSG